VAALRRSPASSPWERQSVSTVQEAGWAPGPVWTGAQNIALGGIRCRTVQPLASLYTDYVMSAHQLTYVTTRCNFRVSFLFPTADLLQNSQQCYEIALLGRRERMGKTAAELTEALRIFLPGPLKLRECILGLISYCKCYSLEFRLQVETENFCWLPPRFALKPQRYNVSLFEHFQNISRFYQVVDVHPLSVKF
jgi:hypothetical protein